MTGARIALWVVGPVLLLGGNLMRDVAHQQARYEWEVMKPQTLHRGVQSSGVMEAVHVAEIKSEVDETVDRKMVKEGDAVQIGQPLLQLSTTKTQLEYQQKQNAHHGVEADYKKAVRELGIQRKLLKNLAVSRQQVEDAAQAVEKMKAMFEMSAQELVLSKKKLESTLVRAPIKGVVLKDFTKLGMAMSVGKDLITVGDISKFIVRAKVDELDISQVRVGQMVEIRADAFPNKVMQGKVISIASQAERETFAKVEVVIDILDTQGESLRHNLSVRVNIIIEDIPNALSVPVRSVVKKEGDLGWVVVKNEMHVIGRRRVKLGVLGGDRVQVLSGLSPNDSVGIEKAADNAAP